MVSFDCSHWLIIEGKCGLLLFAQSFEELMASHSHDSHKVPALNFHFVCLEIANVIALIENNILYKGNLIPLISEAQLLFTQDPIAQRLFGNDFWTACDCMQKSDATVPEKLCGRRHLEALRGRKTRKIKRGRKAVREC